MTGARVVIAAVVVALGVSACSGSDPEPKVAPPSSSAPSDPSTSPVSGPTAPTMPPEAMGHDAKAAEAFVKFYWDTVNYAQASGDLDGLRALADSACRTCESGLKYLEKVFRAGGRISGGEGKVAIKTVGFVQDHGHSDAFVRFTLTTDRQRVDYPGSKRDETYTGGSAILNAMLTPTGDGWLMKSLGTEKS